MNNSDYGLISHDKEFYGHISSAVQLRHLLAGWRTAWHGFLMCGGRCSVKPDCLEGESKAQFLNLINASVTTAAYVSTQISQQPLFCLENCQWSITACVLKGVE